LTYDIGSDSVLLSPVVTVSDGIVEFVFLSRTLSSNLFFQRKRALCFSKIKTSFVTIKRLIECSRKQSNEKGD
jgi:hypothetical protein